MLRQIFRRLNPPRPHLHSLSPPKPHLERFSNQVEIEKMAGNSDNHITHVLFCGPYWPASQNYTRDYLRSHPYIQVDVVPLDDVPDVIDKYHLCVVKNLRLDSKVIARAKQMKLIMQFGVGLEGVDVVAATQCGIKVARIPGNVTGNSASCAEMAIYLMLGLLKKQKEMEAVLKTKRLGEPVGETLLGKTVFIMGFGAIGRDLAKRLRPFGVRILATKRSWALEQPESNQSNGFSVRSPTLSMESDGNDSLVDKKGGPENLFEFAREADIVVTCLALNPETAGIVNQKFLSSMRQGSLLVNIARGGLLDYESVKHHLESGHLGGLALDVTWTEPFDPEDPILKFPNVLVTPHVAGVTEFSYRTMAKVVGDCALQLHAGDPLTGIEFVN
eukprot:TRINITY_DN4928_c0_g1_i1.p1 TRINITY_DN4928_c0_g1~~TRINITY_DN4928_c0_g1_i1.p1  ORF type:complete len:388 (-),score=79.92 TRINITY_DN4928_c0_g1_i1:326-1489(-)